MTEIARITSLFEKLYNGDPWLDVNLYATLSNITAAKASKRVGTSNSIWEITSHLIDWRFNVLHRVQGQIMKTPSNNYIIEIKDISDQAWSDTIQKLEDTQQGWLNFLKNVKPEDLEKIYPVNEMTYYEHIQGIIQHDAYHLGQIMLLIKHCESL